MKPSIQDATYTIGWPPSINAYWRVHNGRVIISREGRSFINTSLLALRRQYKGTHLGRLRVKITLHPPDHRKRDCDNYSKATLDVFTKARIWQDDSQIDVLTIERGAVIKGGGLVLSVGEITNLGEIE